LCLAIATGCTGGDTESGDGGSETGDPSSTAGTMSQDGGPADGGPVGDDGATAADDGGSATTGTAGDDTGTDDATPTSSTGEGDSSGSGSGEDDSSGSSEDGGSESTGAVVDDDGPPELCEAPGNLVTCDPWGEPITIFNAIGLGCAGGPDEAIPIVGEGFNASDPESWAIATQLGTYVSPAGDPIWGPTEGESMLVLSSGIAGVPDAAGVITHASLDIDDNGNPSDKPLPAPMTAASGSGAAPFVGCDGVGDCSDSLQGQWAAGGSAANDLAWFQFSSQVPGGTHGFSIDFAYFSEEFPEWVGTQYNDMFVVWSNSETYTGNLCFVDDQPCTVTALWPTQYQNNDPPELAETGFPYDGATGWFQIKGSAEPLELLQLTFAVFDMGDEVYDTLVLLDNFAWDCEGCTPTEVNPCGVVDPV
jgi:hypothetical protein